MGERVLSYILSAYGLFRYSSIPNEPMRFSLCWDQRWSADGDCRKQEEAALMEKIREEQAAEERERVEKERELK